MNAPLIGANGCWYLLLLAMALTAAGCATTALTPAGKDAGKLALEEDEGRLWSRAREEQERLRRAHVEFEDPALKAYLNVKLPPHEVAEIELDDHRSNPNVYNFTVEENVPATVDGRRGFRLFYTWTTKNGYRLKRIQYGFLEGKWVYQLNYQAAARHYFDRDLATFEKLRESFRILTKPA